MSNIPDNNRPSAETGEEPPSPEAVGQTLASQRNPLLQSEVEVEINIDPQLTTALDRHFPDHQSSDRQSLMCAAKAAAAYRGFTSGTIGIRVTDDATIREINAKHLDHDWPTDVISFGYRAVRPLVDGELVVSLCTAKRLADELGWPAWQELMLYVVHGSLHITGMDDHDGDDRRQMRVAESAVMAALGIEDFESVAVDRDQHLSQRGGARS